MTTKAPAKTPGKSTAKTPGKATAKTPGKAGAKPPAKTCNVPSIKYGRCRRATEWRGLCAAHRMTHRGLADPKEGTRHD